MTLLLRPLVLALTGFTATSLAIFYPLEPWSLPAQIAGILLLALGAHGLIVAVDPPEKIAGEIPEPADLDERRVWPRHDLDRSTPVTDERRAA